MARLKIGDSPPPFDLPGVDGASHSPGDFDDRPLAVVFSCVHCPYVKAWEDRLNDIARDYADSVGFIFINPNSEYLGDSFDDMVRRSSEKGFVFPFVFDESQEIAHAYSAARTPEVFLFDGGHKLVYHGAPDSDHTDPGSAEPYFRNALDAMLAGESPSPEETPPVGCTVKYHT